MTVPTKVLVFQNRFLLGGQERQTVMNVKTMDRTRFEPVVACLRADGELLPELAEAGFRPTVFDVGASMLRPRTALVVAQIARFIRSSGIGLVHAQDLYTNTLGTIAARLAGVPAIVTRVDLNHSVVGYKRPVLGWVSRHADRVLVNALCIRDLAIREGVEPDRIVVVRNGLDLEAFDRAARRAPERPAPEPGGIVCIANMHHPVKGQTDLLLAMKDVLRERPEAHLDLRRRRRPPPAPRALGAPARDLGALPLPGPPARRSGDPGARGDLGVRLATRRGSRTRSSRGWRRASPSSRRRWAARRSSSGTAVTGHLVPPGAPAPLARTLVELLARPQRRKRMGERGRRVVEREFGVDQMRRSYDALYEDLTGLKVPRVMYGAA